MCQIFIPIGHLRSHYCSAMTRQCELGGWTHILARALIVLFMKRWKHQMTLKHVDRKSVSLCFRRIHFLPTSFTVVGTKSWCSVIMGETQRGLFRKACNIVHTYKFPTVFAGDAQNNLKMFQIFTYSFICFPSWKYTNSVHSGSLKIQILQWNTFMEYKGLLA